MISIENVSKNFDHKVVLKNIDLRLPVEQTHVFLGSSGCGKSTLLRLLMGLIKPDSGRVLVNDTVVAHPPNSIAARRVGYVIQDGGLFPHMTARLNVTLPARVERERWSQSKIKSRLEELSQLVGFDNDILDRYPIELSGGQRQRVGLIRALMLDPPVLLLDEPLGALDPIVRAALQDELKKTFNKLKKTVVMVTHDIGEAAYFGHTISLLNNGQLIQHGVFDDFVKHPKSVYVTQFIQAQRPPPQLRQIL